MACIFSDSNRFQFASNTVLGLENYRQLCQRMITDGKRSLSGAIDQCYLSSERCFQDLNTSGQSARRDLLLLVYFQSIVHIYSKFIELF